MRRPVLCSSKTLTLVELLVVMLVVVALAGVLVPNFGNVASRAQGQGTEVSLSELRETVVGSAGRPGYLTDLRALPTQLADLFRKPVSAPDFDPVKKLGWRGPYLLNPTGRYTVDVSRGFTVAYGAAGDPALLDGYGAPLVLQRPSTASASEADKDLNARLVSAGPNGRIDTAPATLTPTAAERGDDLVLFLKRSDPG